MLWTARSPVLPSVQLKASTRRVAQVARALTPATAQMKRNHSDVDDWKNSPPYAKDKETKNGKVKYHGACFCDRVKFEVFEDPLAAKFCHCTTCQRLHGAPMQAAAIFHKNHVLFSQDSLEHLAFLNNEKKENTRELPCKVSCSFCRCPICDEGRNMLMMFPPLFKFDRNKIPDKFRPTDHIFYGQRMVDINDGKPKWEGHKDDSKRIDESHSGTIGPDKAPDHDNTDVPDSDNQIGA